MFGSRSSFADVGRSQWRATALPLWQSRPWTIRGENKSPHHKWADYENCRRAGMFESPDWPKTITNKTLIVLFVWGNSPPICPILAVPFSLFYFLSHQNHSPSDFPDVKVNQSDDSSEAFSPILSLCDKSKPLISKNHLTPDVQTSPLPLFTPSEPSGDVKSPTASEHPQTNSAVPISTEVVKGLKFGFDGIPKNVKLVSPKDKRSLQESLPFYWIRKNMNRSGVRTLQKSEEIKCHVRMFNNDPFSFVSAVSPVSCSISLVAV